MAQVSLTALDSLPLGVGGKIDRMALPEPAEQSDADGGGDAAPADELEVLIAGAWQEVLGRERVLATDDFFALGGHSLLATQVVAQVRSDFAVDLPLHSLFTHPTVASLSDSILGLLSSSEDDEAAKLIGALETMSDEEAERLLAAEGEGSE